MLAIIEKERGKKGYLYHCQMRGLKLRFNVSISCNRDI